MPHCGTISFHVLMFIPVVYKQILSVPSVPFIAHDTIVMSPLSSSKVDSLSLSCVSVYVKLVRPETILVAALCILTKYLKKFKSGDHIPATFQSGMP